MSESNWKILFHTCDCGGDYMKLGDSVEPTKRGERIIGGDIFPCNVKETVFDVKLPNGKIFEKCLVVDDSFGDHATAIMQDGSTLELEHKTLLRANPDKEVEKKLNKIYFDIVQEKNRQQRIQCLEDRKRDLTAKLKETNAELKKLYK